MPPRVKKNQVVIVNDCISTMEPLIPVEPVATSKKRGRKQPEGAAPSTPTPTQIPEENTVIMTDIVVSKQKKKRTLKKTEPPMDATVATEYTMDATVAIEYTMDATVATEYTMDASLPHSAVVASNKKRGRKPKGGKLIQQLTNDSTSVHVVPNIILHLKCSVLDIHNDLTASNDNFKPGDVVSFNTMDPKGSDLNDSYQSQMSSVIAHAHDDNKSGLNEALIGNNAYNYLNDTGSDNEDDNDDGNHSMKDILKKLNHLKTSFHRSDVFQAIGATPRRSCCFWDTCEFDTPPVYLPKSVSNNGYVVYACFCSPECALAYLMNERIDTSVKFERCQMLNAMHGKINVSIKPAPNPQYILSKFYGNLSIQEYRKLFKGEQIVYVVNKPLTHILPEIYEENNDFMLNNKIIPTNNYKPKKKFGVF